MCSFCLIVWIKVYLTNYIIIFNMYCIHRSDRCLSIVWRIPTWRGIRRLPMLLHESRRLLIWHWTMRQLFEPSTILTSSKWNVSISEMHQNIYHICSPNSYCLTTSCIKLRTLLSLDNNLARRQRYTRYNMPNRSKNLHI